MIVVIVTLVIVVIVVVVVLAVVMAMISNHDLATCMLTPLLFLPFQARYFQDGDPRILHKPQLSLRYTDASECQFYL